MGSMKLFFLILAGPEQKELLCEVVSSQPVHGWMAWSDSRHARQSARGGCKGINVSALWFIMWSVLLYTTIMI